ncbi:hypothetical protein AKO1_004205 [Acrasis kona]|uniref:Cytochrome b5 heme-binding domain-containing protein n=1 Tax=Acrasis kona TaxID=1008807 RepID=A0AAW2YGN6_9EUKA
MIVVVIYMYSIKKKTTMHSNLISVPVTIKEQKKLTTKRISRMMLLEHGKNSQTKWMVLYGLVLDVTNFRDEHPGGEDNILKFVGEDATFAYDECLHSTYATERVLKMIIGVMIDGAEEQQKRIYKNHQVGVFCDVIIFATNEPLNKREPLPQLELL